MSNHLVVVHHGMCAEPAEVQRIAEGLESAFGEKLRVLNASVNTKQTTDGVAAAGARLAELIRMEAPPHGGRLSLVAHSMGGVVARWAVKELEEQDWFAQKRVHAVNFVTTASPHLGLSDVGTFWYKSISLTGPLVGLTVKDLLAQSDVLKEDLIGEVALRGLQRFCRRALYGNLEDDVGVRPCTSLLLPLRPEVGSMPVGVPQSLSLVRDGEWEAVELGPDFTQPQLHAAARQMLHRLDTLAWERYAVHFPFNRWKDWRGDAHHKICNHSKWDRHNCGRDVVAHICQTFALEPKASGNEALAAAAALLPPAAGIQAITKVFVDQHEVPAAQI